ncbi:MAG TPA: hypothetical protein VNO43_02515 [Candidatus Eisenbacteria bacterium]|nr:hypothetical protein [Candidatus Eisenbacteria bacterium]
MKLHSMHARTAVSVVAAVVVIPGILFFFVPRKGNVESSEEALRVIRAYLRALHSRDFHAAYAHIASTDKRVWEEADYVAAQGGFEGYTLQLARTLAEYMEVWPIESKLADDRATITVGYRAPSAEDLAGMVFDWNTAALNALLPAQQERLLALLRARKHHGRLVMVEGQETFELVSERGAWKLFFDWASGTKVRLGTVLPKEAALDVQLARKELIAKAGEPFQINLKVINRSRSEAMLKVQHEIDPPEFRDRIAMIDCGLSTPVTLAPGRTQEFSMAYLIEAPGPAVRQLSLTYAFELTR